MSESPTPAERTPEDDRMAIQELYRISADQESDVEEKTRAMLDLGCSYLDLAIGFVSYVDAADDHFEIVEARGDHDLIRAGETSPLSETYCRKTIDSDGLLGVRDAAAEGWEGDPAYEKFDLGCYLGGKLSVDGDLYGTLCFADESAREVSFSPAERTFVELTSQWLSYELKQREQERALRTERDFVQDVIDTLEDGVFVIDSRGEFVRWNDHLNERLGYDDAAIESMDPLDVFVEGDRDRVAEAIGAVFDTGAASVSATALTAGGERVPYEVRARRLEGPDGETWLCGVARDVTGQKAREEELTQYERIVETMDDAAWIVDPEARFRFVNDRATEVLDAPEERILGRRLDELLDDDTVEGDALSEYVDRLRAVLAGERDGFRMDLELAFGWDRGVLDVRVVPLASSGSVEGAVAVARDVTRQKRREERLAQYEVAMENVEGMVYVLDANDRFSIVTPGFADRLRYDRDDLLGEPVSTVFPDGDGRGRADRVDELDTADPGVVSYETEVVTAGGERVPVRVDASALPDDHGTAAAVTDLTELEETRGELHDERDRFEFLFENVPDPVDEVRFVDGEPIIEAVNTAFEDVFGYDEAEAVGRSANDLLVPPSDLDAARDLDERALVGEDTTTEVRRETVEGPRDFLFRGVIFENEGDKRGFGIYTDIADQKRRERYLTVLSRVLRHNLRNDLNVVMGQAGIIADRIESADLADPDRFGDVNLAESARQIEATASSLVELSTEAREIERVLDPQNISREPVDIAAVLHDVAEAFRSSHPEARFEIDASDAPPVEADHRLRVAIEELVENAVEHAGEEPRVELCVEAAGEWVEVTVADDGPGLPAVERGVVTGETEITQLAHGSGLGLWVVRWIVESYGGEVDFDVGAGTAVTLRLRAASG